jgi:tetratricopeptide (TPR) repeat protein
MKFLRSLFQSRKIKWTAVQEVSTAEFIKMSPHTFTLPTEAEDLLSFGATCIQLGNYNGALRCYQAFMNKFKEDSHQAQGYYCLGFVYTNMKKLDEAIMAYNNAIKIDTCSVKSYKGLGDVFSQLGNFKKARDCYLKLYHTAKDDRLSHALALVEYELGKVHMSIKYTKDAISIDPDNPYWYAELGRFYHAAGKFDEFKKYVDESARKYPLNIFLRAINNNDEALNKLKYKDEEYEE